jgi:hypothetical protein
MLEGEMKDRPEMRHVLARAPSLGAKLSKLWAPFCAAHKKAIDFASAAWEE